MSWKRLRPCGRWRCRFAFPREFAVRRPPPEACAQLATPPPLIRVAWSAVLAEAAASPGFSRWSPLTDLPQAVASAAAFRLPLRARVCPPRRSEGGPWPGRASSVADKGDRGRGATWRSQDGAQPRAADSAPLRRLFPDWRE